MTALTVTIWDVQHGSAAHLQTPNGQHVAIDLGTGSLQDSDDAFSPMLYLAARGVRTLDGLIITHPHRDHMDDINNLDYAGLRPRLLHRPTHLSDDEIRAGNRREDTDIVEAYLRLHHGYNGTSTITENCFAALQNGGVAFQVFYPRGPGTGNLNNHSIVTIVEYLGVKILIPGDNEAPSWDELLARSAFRAAVTGTHLLVAAHHGRDSGYHADLFQLIKPLLVIISDGRFCDTSATSRYCAVTKGWPVRAQDGTVERRQCLTTRQDGHIQLTIRPGTGSMGSLSVLTS